MEEKSYHFINSFYLKIIGMVTMVIDHFAVVAIATGKDYLFNIETIHILRIIGRLSFTIFAFQVVESILKSKSPLKYLIRLCVLAIICDLGLYLFTGEYFGNPISPLFIGATLVYLLNNKNWYIKLLSIIPLSFTILCTLNILPFKLDAGLNGVLTILIFYISYLLSKYSSKMVISNFGLDEETFTNSSYAKTLRNSISCILYLSYSIIIYFINPVWHGVPIFSQMMTTQVYSVLALIPIFFYNGKRGYNKPWFKYACYAFFPLHLIILYGIFIFML